METVRERTADAFGIQARLYRHGIVRTRPSIPAVASIPRRRFSSGLPDGISRAPHARDHGRRPVHSRADLRLRGGAAGRPGRGGLDGAARRRTGRRHDPAVVTNRIIKECVHELGHTFGLLHCDTPDVS